MKVYIMKSKNIIQKCIQVSTKIKIEMINI